MPALVRNSTPGSRGSAVYSSPPFGWSLDLPITPPPEPTDIDFIAHGMTVDRANIEVGSLSPRALIREGRSLSNDEKCS